MFYTLAAQWQTPYPSAQSQAAAQDGVRRQRVSASCQFSQLTTRVAVGILPTLASIYRWRSRVGRILGRGQTSPTSLKPGASHRHSELIPVGEHW